MYSPRFAMFTSFTTYSDDLIESDDHKIRFAQVTRPYGKPCLGKRRLGSNNEACAPSLEIEYPFVLSNIALKFHV